MKIYIASSWRNQHGVELLTEKLRNEGHAVKSWIENSLENGVGTEKDWKFEKWVNTDAGQDAFHYDCKGAMECDVFVYLGVGGKDAMAECGMCYGQRLTGRRIPMYALWAKGEDLGLTRFMFDAWLNRVDDLLDTIKTETK